MIRAVTFDLWDTIVKDDSDESRRAAQGLRTKKEARRELFAKEIQTHHPDKAHQIDAAFDHANAWFQVQWKQELQTPSYAERMKVACGHLGVPTTPGFSNMVATVEAMEVQIPPDLADGIQQCLSELHGVYRLGIISDAIVTPGSSLRKILHHHGLAQYFDAFVFSDEAGAAKPNPTVFEQACQAFHVEPAELLHIGDRESNDIAGPLDFGAHSILYTGIIDRGSHQTRASAVCSDHQQMPSIIAALNR